MVSTASTFTAIDRIGLSMSTGLLSGTSVIVSFSFGALVQGEAFSSTFLAVAAIFVLVLAITAYAAAGQLASAADQEAEEGALQCYFTHMHKTGAMFRREHNRDVLHMTGKTLCKWHQSHYRCDHKDSICALVLGPKMVTLIECHCLCMYFPFCVGTLGISSRVILRQCRHWMML